MQHNPASRRARLAGHLFMLAFLAAWMAYSSVVDSYVMPGPWAVAQRLVQMFGDVHEVKHMLYSFAHIIAAVAMAITLRAPKLTRNTSRMRKQWQPTTSRIGMVIVGSRLGR